MTTADHAGSRTPAAGDPARRRTSTGTWLTAARPGPAHDDGAQEPGVPTDAVDAAVRHKAPGQGGVQGVLRALAGSTLYLPADSAGLPAGCAGRRMGFTVVFTDPRHAPPSSPRVIPVTAFWLLAALPPTTTLWINPDGDAPYCVFVDDLRDVAAEPAAALSRARHPDGTDSALRSAYGRFRQRSALSGERHHGHAHNGPADQGAASGPLPVPGP